MCVCNVCVCVSVCVSVSVFIKEYKCYLACLKVCYAKYHCRHAHRGNEKCLACRRENFASNDIARYLFSLVLLVQLKNNSVTHFTMSVPSLLYLHSLIFMFIYSLYRCIFINVHIFVHDFIKFN